MNNEYVKRMNAVIQYIKDNSSERITLEELAEHSNFSKFHFSRIFTSIVGVTPIAYVNQVRLHNSIQYLTDSDRTILDISQLCGFESVTTFNTAFKKFYNRTPSEVRASGSNNSNISLIVSNNEKELFHPLNYDEHRKISHFLRRIWDMNVTIKELPAYEVAYVRHIGSYLDTHLAWSVLGKWANEHQLTPMSQYFIGISLDDPATVEESECRYDACITLPEDFVKKNTDVVQFKTLSGGTYALYNFYDTVDKLAIAYQSLFDQWLPNSEYDSDDRPCLEFCMNDPANDQEGKCKVELYIPIRGCSKSPLLITK
ncbi:transcriptional regulator, AraC family [Paenibacillus uliginis N3/975]|uniref:Transcriptional regulator, AraC family n=1 Tax=Paenibacillus uliginis N3/975 TaxID=1313296 RepID=A0A1X7HQA8_9BACL|nr:AraC family transcriptional regulator [Paenibacillus uliginis]SMF90301.1 transcriptional regulator, AraC family [Paenibacillus uliginis N3/975]